MYSKYTFDIPNPNKERIQLFSNIIVLLQPLLFLVLSYYVIDKQKALLADAIVIFIMIIIYFIFQKKKWGKPFYNSLYSLPVFFFLNHEFWWIGSLLFLVFMLYIAAISEKKILFEQSQVKMVQPFSKSFQWTELQNAILKDGLLTLDFKNNKLLQTPIINQLNEAETKQFNDFCQERLRARD